MNYISISQIIAYFEMNFSDIYNYLCMCSLFWCNRAIVWNMAMATSTTVVGSDSTQRIDSHINGGSYCLVLTEENVVVTQRSQEISRVLVEDILGVETTKGRGRNVDLTIHGFPKTRKLFRGETRWRVKIIHSFDSEDPTENERLAKEWKQKIVIQSRKVIQKKYNWYYEGT